jgi:outer membrane protein assembly factor BamB
MIAIIPTFFILGPLAILAALVPFVFGGLGLLLKRWRVLLLTGSIDSTLYFAHSWFRGLIKDNWLGSLPAIWIVMSVIAAAAALWSWRRYRGAFKANDPMAAVPATRSEIVILALVSLVGLGAMAYCFVMRSLAMPPWRELSVVWFVAWIGAAAIFLSRRFKLRRAVAETAMLSALTLCCAGFAVALWPAHSDGKVRVVWMFEPAERGAIWSSPFCWLDDRIYVGAIHGGGTSTSGALYCIDRESGKQIWKFNDGGHMKEVFSSPQCGYGRVFVGEGLHEDNNCRFYCVDVETGKKIWDFKTKSHVESSPCMGDRKVYFGAGDDGLYCLDTDTGKLIWQFHEGHHIDANPVLAGGRIYVGTGVGAGAKEPEILCLDADSGNVIWRRALDLPAWGSPLVVDWIKSRADMWLPLGNGRYNRSAQPPERPAGACMYLDANSGKVIWRVDVPDSVFTQPGFHSDHTGLRVFFGCRDGNLYCVQGRTGTLNWKYDMRSAVVATPYASDEVVYVLGSEGRVCALDQVTGASRWTFDVSTYTRTKVQLFSSPTEIEPGEGSGQRRRLYFGAGLDNSVTQTGVVFCLEER